MQTSSVRVMLYMPVVMRSGAKNLNLINILDALVMFDRDSSIRGTNLERSTFQSSNNLVALVKRKSSPMSEVGFRMQRLMSSTAHDMLAEQYVCSCLMIIVETNERA